MAELVSIPISDTTIAVGLGGLGGGIQTPILREFVDRKYPISGIEALKGFGYPGTLIGTVAGVAALAIGAIGMSKGKDGKSRIPEPVNLGVLAYGTSALAGGVASGMWPAVTAADCAKAATAAVPTYFYDGICHKTAKTATTGMQGYEAPPEVEYASTDMTAVRKMAVELQRLAQENAQLKAQIQTQTAHPPAIEVSQIIPGAVKTRQERYGFMEPGAEIQQPLVTKRTEQNRKRFDFMG